MMDVPLADAAGAVLVSKRMFKKLPSEYQTILREKGREYMKKLVSLSREDNQKSVELMRENGIQVVNVPEANLPEFTEAGIRARNNLVGKLYSQELLSKVELALMEFRQKASD
jgi:TRAP-type C4-dicarboxylate transport system substrate-binding protein